MRFLRGVRPEAPENAAVAARLSAVADRGKLEGSEHCAIEAPAAARIVQQRFWTPRQIGERDNRG